MSTSHGGPGRHREAAGKARVLAGTLPGLLRLAGRTVVVVVDPGLLGSGRLAESFAQDVAFLRTVGVRVVVWTASRCAAAEELPARVSAHGPPAAGLLGTDPGTVRALLDGGRVPVLYGPPDPAGTGPVSLAAALAADEVAVVTGREDAGRAAAPGAPRVVDGRVPHALLIDLCRLEDHRGPRTEDGPESGSEA
ncbi:hypothetical protein AB0467_31845 [Streptomyces sp. NPDC052095]|uniref:hypothetical protein n=1 Tax=unclassified Streptomyces TaxID=2593676 RepID=UPI00344F1751